MKHTAFCIAMTCIFAPLTRADGITDGAACPVAGLAAYNGHWCNVGNLSFTFESGTTFTAVPVSVTMSDVTVTPSSGFAWSRLVFASTMFDTTQIPGNGTFSISYTVSSSSGAALTSGSYSYSPSANWRLGPTGEQLDMGGWANVSSSQPTGPTPLPVTVSDTITVNNNGGLGSARVSDVTNNFWYTDAGGGPAIPEPATWVLLVSGLCGSQLARRRRVRR